MTRKLGIVGAGALAMLVFGWSWQARASAADEITRLAEAMEWKPGFVVADIGAGDGRFAFAAAEKVGAAGRLYATEIDPEKLKELRAEVKKRGLTNVTIVESAEADTNLPAACCDAIYLRRVYHHLTKPAEFDGKILASLKAGGKLAIIDFPPRAGLEKVEGVPANRGGHGIPEKIVVQELTAAGLGVQREIKDWPDDSYCVVFVKK